MAHPLYEWSINFRFFERYFVIEKSTDIDSDDKPRALLSLIMMVLLEEGLAVRRAALPVD